MTIQSKLEAIGHLLNEIDKIFKTLRLPTHPFNGTSGWPLAYSSVVDFSEIDETIDALIKRLEQTKRLVSCQDEIVQVCRKHGFEVKPVVLRSNNIEVDTNGQPRKSNKRSLSPAS